MIFPVRGVEIIRALYDASPQDDAARREDIQKVGEQMVHDLGNKWGNKKRAGLSDDFRSPDSIAYHEDDGTVSVWDIQASSGAILVSAGDPPTHPNLPPSEAAFMPCRPVDHMGGGQPPGPDPEPPAEDLELRVAALEAIVAELEAQVVALQERDTQQAATILVLASRLELLELHTLKDTDRLKVIGRSEATWGHQHVVNLDVGRVDV